MKKFILIPVLVILFISLSTISKAATNKVRIYIQVDCDDGNGYNWIDNGFTMCIPGECNTCLVLVLEQEIDAVISILEVGGWKITTEISQLTFKTINLTTNKEKISYDNTGFKFTSCFDLKITDCNQYPQLENIVVNLDGITIDENQEITVYVPPIQ